jgi:hypothetical protein
MAENKKKYKARSKMSMSSYQDKHESKHKMHMRLITLIIALITILGLVIIIPFADAAVGAADEATAQVTSPVTSDKEITDGVAAKQVMAIGDGLPDVRVTSQGAGMFTLRNAALIGGGFVVGFLLGELFRKVNKIRDAKNSD